MKYFSCKVLFLILAWPCLSSLAKAPHAGTIIYFNPCSGGCSFNQGLEDNSITNISSIIGSSATFTEFQHGSELWAEVLQCLSQKFSPFDVVVTDKDPGSVAHSEVVVAGSPDEGGFPNSIGAVAPFDCSFIENAPAFTFANTYGSSEPICEAAAAMAAHMFSLDTHYHCEDLMTYLTEDCGPKRFVDQEMQCGEHEPRACQCGGSTENSFAVLLGKLGPAPPLIFEDRFETRSAESKVGLLQ